MANPHRLHAAAPAEMPRLEAVPVAEPDDAPDALPAIRGRILGEIEAALRAEDASVACAHVKLATLYVRAYAARAAAERQEQMEQPSK